jgi:hypothetical protein
MSERLTLRMFNPVQAHKALTATAWPQLKAMLMAGHRMVVEIKPETRSLEQNARLWAMLTEISQQVDWYGNRLTPEEWKDVFSAAMKRAKVVPGLDGGFVVCGQSTSKMTRAEMSEMQTLMEAFGADKGVRFSAVEPSSATQQQPETAGSR